jgi:1-acyl-sn-glycerol-3-phosphate acyltransferase
VSGDNGQLPGRLPTDRDLRILSAALEPVRRWTSPSWDGLERIPRSGPFLLIGNHSAGLGAIDTLLLSATVYEQRGRALRTAGDRMHWRVPGWRDLLERLGGVDGTRENCAALMRAGEPMLIFPGGAREVAKRRGEEYRLIWGERVGFARLAIAHGYPIIPFATVGGDDLFEIVADADHAVMAPLRRLVGRALDGRADFVPPITRGIGPTLIPRAERLYFWFGEPIAPPPARAAEDAAAARAVRDVVKLTVEGGIQLLLARRECEPLGPARAFARAVTRLI